MKSSSSISCNGVKVRQLRVHQSMTQEKLAAMSNVSHRTVQRAERSKTISIETIASLAAALHVTVSDLRDNINDHTHNDSDLITDEKNAVVLRRVTSGKSVMDFLFDSFSSSLSCQAEPTNENVDILSALVEQIETHINDPWESYHEKSSLTLAERLRTSVALTAQLDELEKMGIAVFAGSYTAVPRQVL